jgi:hypothetical protein
MLFSPNGKKTSFYRICDVSAARLRPDRVSGPVDFAAASVLDVEPDPAHRMAAGPDVRRY